MIFSTGGCQRAIQVIPGGVSNPARAFSAVVGDPFYALRGHGAKIISVAHMDEETDAFVCAAMEVLP